LTQARELPLELRSPALADGLSHLLEAERWGLFAHAELLDRITGTLRFQGEAGPAADYLERSCELAPTVEKYLELSSLRLQLGEVEAVREALLRALALEPSQPTATQRLEILEHRQAAGLRTPR
jgi:hypothetical protein